MWFLTFFLLAATAYQGADALNYCECLDIVFVIDTSISISNSEFELIESFMVDFVSQFHWPPNDILWAAVNFSTDARVVFNWNDNPPNDGNNWFLTVKIWLQTMIGRQFALTDHTEALGVVRDVIFNGPGDRDNKRCPNVVILITDGDTTGAIEPPFNTADQVKEDGTIIAIGVGVNSVSGRNTLRRIASVDGSGDPLVFIVDKFYQLSRIVRRVKEFACDCFSFNPACQTCCCGVIYGGKTRQLPDARSRCCGKKIYFPEKATCCDGFLYEGYNEHCTRCCGGRPYNPDTHTCCYNKRIVRSSRNQDQCCGYTAYNQKFEICCNGVVYKRGYHTRCCGRNAYNPHWQICCGWRVLDGCEKEYRCCGYYVAYKPGKQVCCDRYWGIVVDSPVKLCGVDDLFRCGFISYYGKFYGGSKWNPTLQTCCCGQVTAGAVDKWTGCCGTRRYNRDTQLCCNNYLWDLDPRWYQCCGYYAYEISTHTCCHGYRIVKGRGLCCGYYNVFNPETELCCGGYRVVSGAPHKYQCCYSYYYGYRSFNTKNQLCCRGYIRQGGKNYRCCGYYSYNLRKEMCCYGRIFSRKIARAIEFCDNPFDGFIPRGYVADPDAAADPADAVAEELPSETGEDENDQVSPDDDDQQGDLGADDQGQETTTPPPESTTPAPVPPEEEAA